ncbi:negative elongation factor A, putative, partial [Ixodes scapularis]
KSVRSKMAHVRDSDTSLWLHNKLGTSNDLWSGYSICSQLNQDVLKNIRECFIDLQSQVKLKLLLSFLHIPRRNVEEWKVELEEILEVASADSDQWVSMLAELLRSFPSTGTLNFNIEENSGVFVDLCNDLRKFGESLMPNILPLECLYLNKHALTALVGQLPQPVKHFALKRKPKSAALRAELLQKYALSNAKRNTSSSSVPIRCRGLTKNLNDSSPLRGIPSRVPTGGFKTPTSANRMSSGTPLSRSLTKPMGNKKDGGIKVALFELGLIPKHTSVVRRRCQGSRRLFVNCSNESRTVKKNVVRAIFCPCVSIENADALASRSSAKKVTASFSTVDVLSRVLHAVTTSGQVAAKRDAAEQPTSAAALAAPVQQHESSRAVGDQQQGASSANQPPAVQAEIVRRTTATLGDLAALSSGGGMVQHIAVQNVAPAAQQTAVVVTTQPQQLSEAQEMFKNSNKVSRSEKALILGFMAGSRANPCPELGNLITIRLSENKEDIVQPGGAVKQAIVETHFQMNYNTGEWKRVRKIREIED